MDNQDRDLVKKMLQAMPEDVYIWSREARMVADQLDIAHAFVHKRGRRKKTYSVTVVLPKCESWSGWYFTFDTLKEANTFAETVRNIDRLPDEYDWCDLVGSIAPRQPGSGLWAKKEKDSYLVFVAPILMFLWMSLFNWMGSWWPVGGLLLFAWLMCYWKINCGLPKATWWLLIWGALTGLIGQA